MVLGMGGDENSVEIAVESTGVENFQGDMGRAERALGGLESNALAAGTALAGLGIAGAAGIKSAVSGAMDLETAFAEVTTLMGEGDDAAAAFGDDVANLSSEFAAQGGELEVVDGLYSTLSAGIDDAGEATEFMETAMMGAQAGLTDTETAVDALSTVVNGYGLEADDAEGVSDVFFETIRNGKTTFPELSSAIGRVVPIASEMGVGFEEVGAATATLTAQGQSTDEAMTALRSTMTQLMDPTDEAAGVIEELGYESGEALIEAEGFGGGLQLMREAAEENGQSMDDLFTNVRALQAAMPLAGDAADDYNSNLNDMENSAGATEAAFDTMAETSEFQLRQAMNQVSSSVNLLGDALLAQLLPAISGVTDIIETATSYFRGLDEATQGVIARAVLFSTAASLIAGGFLLMQVAAAPAAAAIGAVALPIIKVAALAAVLFAAWETNFLGIRDVTEDTIGAATDTIDTFLSWATGVWDDHGEAVTGTVNETLGTVETRIEDGLGYVQETVVEPTLGRMSELWNRHGDTVVDTTTWALENTIGVATEFLTLLETEVIEPTLGRLGNLWAAHGDEVFGEVFETLEAVYGYVETILTALYENVVLPILEAIRAGWDRWGDEIMTIVEFLFDALNGIQTAGLDTMLVLFEHFFDTVISLVRAGMAIIRGDFGDAYDIMEGLTDRTTERIVGYFTDRFDQITGFIGEWGGRAKDAADDAIGGVRDSIVGTVEDIRDDVFGFLDSITDRIDSVMDRIDDAKSAASDVPGASSVGGAASAAAGAVGLATGGVVTEPTNTIVAEGSESEAVLPLSSLQGLVSNAARSAVSASGGGGGGGVRIEKIEVHANSRREGREAGRGLTEELRSLGFNDP